MKTRRFALCLAAVFLVAIYINIQRSHTFTLSNDEGTIKTEQIQPLWGTVKVSGDSDTDVPCMKLVKSHGGQSIAVYNPQRNSNPAKRLLEENRVNFIRSADYRSGSELEKLVQRVFTSIFLISNNNYLI